MQCNGASASAFPPPLHLPTTQLLTRSLISLLRSQALDLLFKSGSFLPKLTTTQSKDYLCARVQEMAGADGRQLRDLTRRAASLLRMARLALTGATPAHLLAEGEVIDGGSCNPRYESISTEADLESDGEKDESGLLLADDDDSRTGSLSENNTRLVCGGAGDMSNKSQLRHRPATAGAALLRSENVAAPEEESAQPLMPRRGAKRVNDVETVVDHPFGCDRRGREASSLLLLSS
ncbi:uncharacterized protein LOC133904927 [Phragmites australis]|uniref:uncharacterized protein LOC133904927 n=1 Tax=Phragmites australis TaxID=29695 RepID=UPI002D7659AE|nr:uncharacterized protein LOC133904927 [Phragmites australis]